MEPRKSSRRKAKQARSKDTVAAILEGAAQVLLAEGHARATTNRIAERAGVSVGSIYQYFEDKDGIFEALIRREIEAVVVAVRAQESDPDAPVDVQLARLVAASMAAMRHGPELVRALEQVPGAAFRRHLAQARRLVTTQVERLLEAHRDELRVTDLGLAAFMVVSAAEGVGVNSPNELFDERLAAEFAALLKAYLVGTEGPADAAHRRGL